MKIKSVSGMVCYVKDTARTAEFYEALGFAFRKREDGQVTVNVNWFWIDFLAMDEETKPGFTDEAKQVAKGSGVFLYLSVDDVDAAYADLVEKGLKPSSEPKDWPWGNREFVIRDPDGYKLVIFKRK